MKKVIGVYRNHQMHWVGDGFPVKNLFSYDRLGQAISPFLLLDYAAPYPFAPTAEQHGVGHIALAVDDERPGGDAQRKGRKDTSEISP